MLKNFLLLILFGFVGHKIEALCCFSKKAVQRPVPAQIKTPAVQVVRSADDLILKQIDNACQTISYGEVGLAILARQAAESGPGWNDYFSHFIKVQTSAHNLYCSSLENLLGELQDLENYKKFIKKRSPSVVFSDRKLQENMVESASGLPRSNAELIVGYLWQKAQVQATVWCKAGDHIDYIRAVDSKNQIHVLSATTSRRLLQENVHSVMFADQQELKKIDKESESGVTVFVDVLD